MIFCVTLLILIGQQLIRCRRNPTLKDQQQEASETIRKVCAVMMIKARNLLKKARQKRYQILKGRAQEERVRISKDIDSEGSSLAEERAGRISQPSRQGGISPVFHVRHASLSNPVYMRNHCKFLGEIISLVHGCGY